LTNTIDIALQHKSYGAMQQLQNLFLQLIS